MTSLKAPKVFKSVGETITGYVSFAGRLGHTSKGDPAIETISSATHSASTDLTISTVAATTEVVTIDGTTVTIGQAVKFRCSGGTASTLYDITFTVTSSQSNIRMGIAPLKVIANSA